jgi:hypothetical protein
MTKQRTKPAAMEILRGTPVAQATMSSKSAAGSVLQIVSVHDTLHVLEHRIVEVVAMLGEDGTRVRISRYEIS